MKAAPRHTSSSQPFLKLEPYSFGVGDRFSHQAKAQLRACILAVQSGAEVIPVWNKSYREHTIIGSEPASVRAAVEAATRELGWHKPFHIDADHITLKTVDGFLSSSDYYTLDVADSIGKPAQKEQVESFLKRHPELTKQIELPGQAQHLQMSQESAARFADIYLVAAKEAGRIYKRIAEMKGAANFITEVSMDETDSPQTPEELLLILAALADEEVPLQTVAPKFTGRFNKGVDYVGNVAQFEAEFRADIAVIAHAVKIYDLPRNLKLSVHSGSDKFSIYPAIHRALRDTGAGLHLKTAGTTWLEELIGLAEAGGEALSLAKDIYAEAYAHREELCAPYSAVIEIDPARLPAPGQVAQWSSEQYASSLRHDQSCPAFNPSFRQLLHVGYKIAAKLGRRYLDMLDACEQEISRNVTTNLFERHLRPIFLGNQSAPTTRESAAEHGLTLA
jgi:tagaturonate epimerase